MVNNLHLDTAFLQNVEANRLDIRSNISEDDTIYKTLPETLVALTSIYTYINFCKIFLGSVPQKLAMVAYSSS